MNYNGALNKGVLDRFMALDISNTNKVNDRSRLFLLLFSDIDEPSILCEGMVFPNY